nr:MAG TPA: hypothetical protein [Caudoviricetes sp.]
MKRYSFGFKIEDKPETKPCQGAGSILLCKISTLKSLTRFYIAYCLWKQP